MFNLTIIDQFRDAMTKDGITTDAQLIPDEELHRFHVIGDTAGTLNGWYILFPKPFPHAVYSSWKLFQNETKKWSAKSEMEMTQEERKNFFATIAIAKEKQNKVKLEAQTKAKGLANDIWNSAKPAPSTHPYLARKKIKPHCARINNNEELVIPIYDDNKTICSLQFIDNEGRKRFLKDGVIRCSYLSIGTLTDTIYLAEGFATACTIQEITDFGVVITFNCGNLTPVAQAIKAKYPSHKIIIAADNDKDNPNNPGLNKAKEAAKSISVELVYPNFDKAGNPPNASDFNDLCSLLGTNETFRQLTPISPLQKPEVAATSPEPQSDIIFRKVSDIEAKPISWLWNGLIAYGKVSIIAGNPGLGKSQLTANIVAMVTTAGVLPGNQNQCQLSDVAILSAEDDAADTIRPRLEAAGANIFRVFILDAVKEKELHNSSSHRCFNLKTDLKRLEDFLNTIQEIKLLIIDPISAYLGNTDSHKNAEIRALLTPLTELAAKHQIAVLCVSHLSKNANNEAMMRVSGSLAFVAAARAAFLVAQDPADNSKRLFLPLKNNIGNDKTGFAFKIESVELPNGISTSKVVWSNEPITTTANDIVSVGQSLDETGALEEAEEFLLDLLANGRVPSKNVIAEAKQVGHSWSTIRRAKKKLGIIAKKSEFNAGRWDWFLPPSPPKKLKTIEEDHTKNMNPFEEFEPLRQTDTTAKLMPQKNDCIANSLPKINSEVFVL